MSTSDNLHRLERVVLPLLLTRKDVTAIVDESKLQDIEVKRALQWLNNKDLIKTEEEKIEVVELGDNGRRYKETGLPERRALALLAKSDKTTQSLIQEGIAKDEINIIIGALKKKAAIDVRKEGNDLTLSITQAGSKLLDKPSLEERFLQKEFPVATKELEVEERFAVDNLKKRKDIIVIETKKTVYAQVTTKGRTLIKKGISQDAGIDRLTPNMLRDGSWKKKRFRAYDVSINVPRINRGRTHFVNEAIAYAKQLWLEMGFTEMHGNHIQTAFWDLDSLFVPQDHPAREMQDTYYIKDPMKGKKAAKKTYEAVKAVHENGADTGSKGWRQPFDEELSQKNLLRTHTTVLSAQTINKIKESDMPCKFFSVGKVYRNESLDWKHLFEFHQVEGIVVDPNANLRHLKGYLRAFYQKMGFADVRMRPGHFPYTEPSIEVDVWHPVKNEWVEMGGAGIFRPEVTKTLIGTEVPVLAWGLGLERIIMPYYEYNDIRKLYDNDLKNLRVVKNFIR